MVVDKIIQERMNTLRKPEFKDRTEYDPWPISVEHLLCYYRQLKV